MTYVVIICLVSLSILLALFFGLIFDCAGTKDRRQLTKNSSKTEKRRSNKKKKKNTIQVDLLCLKEGELKMTMIQHLWKIPYNVMNILLVDKKDMAAEEEKKTMALIKMLSIMIPTQSKFLILKQTVAMDTIMRQ
jgi:hypothetical protein